MVFRFLSVFILSVACATAYADNLKVMLGSDMARVMYASESLGQSLGRVELEGGYLYSEQNSDTSDYLAHVGFQVRGESLDAPLVVTVGARLYLGSAADQSVGGLGIGGDLLMAPDGWNGFGVGGFLYYVPDVVAFSDAEGLLEYGVTANFQVSSQATVNLGWQNIEVDLKNRPNRTIDDGIFLGVNLAF